MLEEAGNLESGGPATPAPTLAQDGRRTRVVARNSFWYGLEVGSCFLIAFLTSIAIARAIGPRDLAYFTYITWLTNVSAAVGSLGIPATTRKYMAEYLGRGETGIARAVFFATLRLQTALAAGMTTVALILVWRFVDPAHQLMSAFLVAFMFPKMILLVPSQANVAAESMAANLPGSLAGTAVYVVFVVLSLTRGWGLVGIAIGVFVWQWVELTLKMIPAVRRVRKAPKTPLPAALKRRLVRFGGQSMVLMLLNVVIWDRSDIVFLKMLAADVRHLSFFSIAFGLVEKLLMAPRVLGEAIAATLFAEYGRDPKNLPGMTAAALRYLLLCSLPLLLGTAALSEPLIRALFGLQWMPAAGVLNLISVLAVGKVMLLPAQRMLQAVEKQRFLVWWSCLCGAVNVILDLVLIPPFQAMGAAVANGSAQVLAAAGIWMIVLRRFPVPLRFHQIARLAAPAVAMALVVRAVSFWLQSWAALAVGIGLGAFTFLLGLRWCASLDSQDRRRMMQLKSVLPGALRPWASRLIEWLAPAGPAQA